MNEALMKVLPVDASVNVSQGPDIDYGGDYCEAIMPELCCTCILYNAQCILNIQLFYSQYSSTFSTVSTAVH